MNKDIDLVDLRAATTAMQFQIVSTGRRFYCSDETACATFEMLAFSMYARLNE